HDGEPEPGGTRNPASESAWLARHGTQRPNVGSVAELQTHLGSATFSNVNRAGRLHSLLVILSRATARPGIRAVDLAAVLKVSDGTACRDLAGMQPFVVPVR